MLELSSVIIAFTVKFLLASGSSLMSRSKLADSCNVHFDSIFFGQLFKGRVLLRIGFAVTGFLLQVAYWPPQENTKSLNVLWQLETTLIAHQP